MTGPLSKKRIVLGVTGSIACYKSIDLASKFTQAGAEVDVILTDSATKFVTPLSFKSITHRQVVTNIFDINSELAVNHVALAEQADIFVIAPASANTIAKLANGLSDNALLTSVLATKSPIVIAPAMDANMFENTATQRNVATLMSDGMFIAGPAKGRLASGLTGLGRMVEPRDLVGVTEMVLGKNGDFSGKRIVVSAGGTQEAIDPVRTISNRSSGKMGYAIAEAARNRGATVTLVSAPTALPDLVGVRTIKIESALEMKEVRGEECNDAHSVIMAAAVADWRPVRTLKSKAKKSNKETWKINLTKNPDIIANIDSISSKESGNIVKVGFAAESENIIENGSAKISKKGLDFIVANDITAADSGFSVDTNKVTIIHADGTIEKLPLMSKYEVGNAILDRVKTGLDFK